MIDGERDRTYALQMQAGQLAMRSLTFTYQKKEHQQLARDGKNTRGD